MCILLYKNILLIFSFWIDTRASQIEAFRESYDVISFSVRKWAKYSNLFVVFIEDRFFLEFGGFIGFDLKVGKTCYYNSNRYPYWSYYVCAILNYFDTQSLLIKYYFCLWFLITRYGMEWVLGNKKPLGRLVFRQPLKTAKEIRVRRKLVK